MPFSYPLPRMASNRTDKLLCVYVVTRLGWRYQRREVSIYVQASESGETNTPYLLQRLFIALMSGSKASRLGTSIAAGALCGAWILDTDVESQICSPVSAPC